VQAACETQAGRERGSVPHEVASRRRASYVVGGGRRPSAGTGGTNTADCPSVARDPGPEPALASDTSPPLTFVQR